MQVSYWYATTGIIEVGAGLVLLCLPSEAAILLVARPLETPAALTLARVGGAGLWTLGVACWLARSDAGSIAARGLVIALVIYNVGVTLILSAAGIFHRPAGILLWPAVVLHTGMTGWCIMNLMNAKHQVSTILQ